MGWHGFQALVDNFFNRPILARYAASIFGGLGVTVEVAVVVVVAGVGTGLVLALLRCLHKPLIDAMIVAYVDLFRTLPQLVIIIFVYFALPYAGLSLSPFAATAFALTLVLGAFSTEIFWSTIQATSAGQWEAGRALGLGERDLVFNVILPQAVRTAIPMLTNRAIAITKGAALGSAVSLPEILGTALSATQMSANASPLSLAAALYLLLFVPLVILSRHLEFRYKWIR